MTDEEDRDLTPSCRRARPLVHERIDRALRDSERERLESHLATCSDCAAFAMEIERVHSALGELPDVSFPDDALREVWSRTVDAEPWWRTWWAPRPVLAAVAATILAAVALWATLDRGIAPPSGDLSEQELARAVAQTRYALALASNAVRRSEQAAVGQVLRDEVAPALDRIPVRWPDAGAERRNGT